MCDLLVITYQYPYGSGEDFFDSELKYISNLFDHVWLIPARSFISIKWWKSVNKQLVKDIPSNCSVLLPEDNIYNEIIRHISYITQILSCVDYSSAIRNNYKRFLYEIIKESLQSYILLCGVYKLLKRLSSVGIVYTYWKGVATLTFLLLKSKFRNRVKVITRAHGGDLYYNLPQLPTRPFDTYIAKNIDEIVSISIVGANHLIQKGFKNNKIIVSRLGVKIPNNVNIKSNDNIIRIVSCSGIIPIKRVELLAEALLLSQRNVIWNHFGDGQNSDIVQNIINKFSDNIIGRLNGRVSNEYVLNYYQSNPVDVFINVSASEGVPVSIMESLAAGIPCIATNVGGTSEIVNNFVGYLLPSNCTPKEIIKCIEGEIQDTISWVEKRKNARLQAEIMCNEDINYTHFKKTLLKLLQ